MYTNIHVEYPLFLSDFNEILFSGSQVVPHGQTHMMKLTVTIYNFVKVPKNHTVYVGNNTAGKSSSDMAIKFLVLLTWLYC
jgi:hypothetical protein